MRNEWGTNEEQIRNEWGTNEEWMGTNEEWIKKRSVYQTQLMNEELMTNEWRMNKELRKIMTSMGEKMSKSEQDTMIKEADSDGLINCKGKTIFSLYWFFPVFILCALLCIGGPKKKEQKKNNNKVTNRRLREESKDDESISVSRNGSFIKGWGGSDQW